MLPTQVNGTINRVNLLTITVRLYTYFIEAHQSHHIANLHVLGSSDYSLVIHFVQVTSQCRIKVEIPPRVIIEGQKLEVIHAITEIIILQVTGFISRRGRSLVVFKSKPIKLSSCCSLYLQVLSDVPDNLTIETELVFLRAV